MCKRVPDGKQYVSDQPPENLKERGPAFWRKATTERQFAEAHDLLRLATLCKLVDDEHDLERRLEADGWVYRDRWGKPRIHPAARLLVEIRQAIFRCIRELGLDLIADVEAPRLPGIFER